MGFSFLPSLLGSIFDLFLCRQTACLNSSDKRSTIGINIKELLNKMLKNNFKVKVIV